MNTEVSKVRLLLVVTLSLCVIAFLSINNQSFWIDEGIRYGVSTCPDESLFLRWAASEKQFLFHILGRGWIALVGQGEAAIRCFNIPFYLIACFYLGLILCKKKINLGWILVVAAHPFVVYYLNEYSPYIALLACTLGILYHSYYSEKTGSFSAALLAQLCFALGYGLHFVFGFAGFLYIFLLGLRWYKKRAWSAVKNEIIVALLLSPVYLGLTWMYLHFMTHGADRGWDPPDLGNVLYGLYSFFGMQGLGLPRNDLRAGNFDVITPTMITLLCGLFICLVLLFVSKFRHVLQEIRSHVFISSVVAWCIFMLAAYMMNFHFWERHVVFLFPVIVLLLVSAMAAAWKSKHHVFYKRSLVVLTIGLLLTSSCRLIYCYDYWKEDYKGVFQWVEQHFPEKKSCSVLSQGWSVMFHYYDIPAYYVGKQQYVDNNSVGLIESLNETEIINHVYRGLIDKPYVCLILWEKSWGTRNLYKNAELYFEQNSAWKVVTVQKFNTFKIFVLKKGDFFEL